MKGLGLLMGFWILLLPALRGRQDDEGAGLWRLLAQNVKGGGAQVGLFRYLEANGTRGKWWRDDRLRVEPLPEPVLFTGYFRLEVQGSRKQTPRMAVPVYGMPQRACDALQPRTAIVAGALQGRAPVLFWTDDPVRLFFLHIQGSGLVRFEDGQVRALGWAGSNGEPYHPIGRDALALGWVERDTLGMRSLVRALREHPHEAQAVMNRNRRYSYFHWEEDHQARGSMGLGLPPLHALAADTTIYPPGTVLVWELELPEVGNTAWETIRQGWGVVMDEGAGVKGARRLDLFCGDGPKGEDLASDLKHQGRVWRVRMGASEPQGFR